MNMDDDRVILVGGFHEVIELCEICNKKIVGIIDDKLTKNYFGYEILGNDGNAPELFKDFGHIPIIITPDRPAVRKGLVQYYSGIGFDFCSLIHPKSTISLYSVIGRGVVIQNGVNISTEAKIGDFVKINTGANIMHDVIIENFTTVAPGSTLLGRVKVADLCFIGAGSVVLPELNIGSGAVVGAGAIVTKSVEVGNTVAGNPAKTINVSVKHTLDRR